MNKLTTASLTKYYDVIDQAFADNPALNGGDLVTALDAHDVTEREGRLTHALRAYARQNLLEGAVPGVLTAVTVTAGGAGYAVGDEVVITGDGEGAKAVVSAVDGSGAVTAIDILSGGQGYTTITLDLSGSGDGAATATGTLTDYSSQAQVIEDALQAVSGT